ncbi:hypothetical protein [Corynebacterium coyleae]|uniref:hypothetical protein n=1 Tax=Corynebacterium coyleae TaxID=53374 RepID=UPI00254A0C65|nr:hypothetical protein [Corynebacterium coyleae]MDK8663521.1 hypothetical protein [Corynebacterium coyleae]MDK8707469.1 hypothetical protein [Corynebacterium coyleae]MDK8734317.1 hypothetical protein [Corynebacterium coyleae]MDK8893564.1 hypothetical protein [Corynebacterium coyleae]
MKRITTAAVAATLPLSLVAGPAFAAEEDLGSSLYYRDCKVQIDEVFLNYDLSLKEAKTDQERAEIKQTIEENKTEYSRSTTAPPPPVSASKRL